MWDCLRLKKKQQPDGHASLTDTRPAINAQQIVITHQQTLNQQELESLQLRKQYGDLSMRGQYWKIGRIKYERGRWQKLFEKIEAIQARYFQVNVGSSSSTNLPRQLSLIKFQNLIALYLHGNGITSIECLAMLYAPNLVDLDLRSNNITSIRSLRKCGFRLDHLFLNNNPLMELAGLSGIHFHRRVKRGFVTSYTHSTPLQTRLILANMSELAKMEASFVFQHLQITPRAGLNNFQLTKIGIRNCIQNRYPQQRLWNEDDDL